MTINEFQMVLSEVGFPGLEEDLGWENPDIAKTSDQSLDLSGGSAPEALQQDFGVESTQGVSVPRREDSEQHSNARAPRKQNRGATASYVSSFIIFSDVIRIDLNSLVSSKDLLQYEK